MFEVGRGLCSCADGLECQEGDTGEAAEIPALILLHEPMPPRGLDDLGCPVALPSVLNAYGGGLFLQVLGIVHNDVGNVDTVLTVTITEDPTVHTDDESVLLHEIIGVEWNQEIAYGWVSLLPANEENIVYTEASGVPAESWWRNTEVRVHFSSIRQLQLDTRIQYHFFAFSPYFHTKHHYYDVTAKILKSIQNMYILIRMVFGRFNPQQAKNMDSIMIIGKRATGKTVLVKDLLQYIPFEQLVTFNSTDKEYSEDSLQKFLMERKTTLRHQRACVVFDGCMYDKSCWKLEPMHDLYTNTRFLRTHIIMVMDYPMVLPPIFLCCVDYVFIFYNEHIPSRKRLYEDYTGMFPTFEDFCQVFDQLKHEPFTCMVINNTSISNRLEDQVMWYKCDT